MRADLQPSLRPAPRLDLAPVTSAGERTYAKRLLVAWFRYAVTGGIGRFINIARTLRRFGHEVCFLSLTGETETDWPDFPGPVLTLEQAQDLPWDAVMLPGAGEENSKLQLLGALRQPQFGVRVQHLLGDPSFIERYTRANEFFEPHLVVVNNSQWRLSDFGPLSADGFHVLPGAVDTDLFYPAPLKTAPCTPSGWAVGACAAKNLAPLLDAFEMLPDDHQLQLYGRVPPAYAPRVADLERRGRVVVRGPLFDDQLCAFYRSVDVVVTTDDSAGWCNTAAEASACGAPCVVTPHGTVDFAENLGTALVLAEPTGPAIADAVRRLTGDPSLLSGIARRAAARMRSFSWPAYCSGLLGVLDAPRGKSYYRVPELGLWGKWDPEVRLAGLRPVLDRCADCTVLDLGAAEGVVAYTLAKAGAALIHAFELDPGRVDVARRILSSSGAPRVAVRQADLGQWASFAQAHADLLQPRYDIVLFLGLYQHLPPATRRDALAGALERCARWLALRLPEPLVRQDRLVDLLATRGFALLAETPADPEENLGWLGVFERNPDR